MFVTSNLFEMDKAARNTIVVRPSYQTKRLIDHNKAKRIVEKVEVIYEEVEDDF